MAKLLKRSDWRQVLAKRATAKDDKTALMDAIIAFEPEIDREAMTARAIISTPNPDRSDDIVVQEGILLDNYRNNPVVYFDHGFSGLATPIGKSEDEDGNLTVAIGPQGMEATTYFSQSSCEAQQIFSLIDERIIRSESVRINPIEASLRPRNEDGRQGLQIDSCELLEHSWVGIPDNPEAVGDAIRKIIDGGRLAGSPICEPILKSLQPFAAATRVYGKGFGMPLAKRAKAADPEETPADETEPEVPAADEAGPGDEPAAETEAKEMPLGATLLAAYSDGLKSVLDGLAASMGPLENPGAKDFLSSQVEMLGGLLAEADTTYGKLYPDQKRAMADDGVDEEPAMKSFLHKSALNRLPISGLNQRLTALVTAKNLKPDQRVIIAATATRLAKMLDEVRTMPAIKVHVEPEPDAALLAEITKLKAQFATITKQLQDVLPHKRQAS